jgi:hypothetical protein
MSAEHPTPTDEITGIPLSVAPPSERLPRDDPNIANWHHLWHPSTARQLQSLSGQALRSSRVQLLPVTDHNIGTETYHHYYIGPPLPDEDDMDTQFKFCVLACAGYVPDRVIDLHSRNEPFTRTMTSAERTAFSVSPWPQKVQARDITWYRKNS